MSGLRPVRLLLLLALGGCLVGCPATDHSVQSPAAVPIGPVELLTFLLDEDHYLIPGHRYPVEPTASLQDALQELADQLTRNYFRDGHEPPSDIHIEVLGVHTIDLPSRPLRVVAVNLHDARQAVWRHFFHGSSGGQTTYYLLAATLMQPQLRPPLADGMVVLYNGLSFPELDHIRFDGLVSAESVRPIVVRALQRRPLRPAGDSG